jgi:hypothetical protein
MRFQAGTSSQAGDFAFRATVEVVGRQGRAESYQRLAAKDDSIRLGSSTKKDR